jgi:hypothetical protein
VSCSRACRVHPGATGNLRDDDDHGDHQDRERDRCKKMRRPDLWSRSWRKLHGH